MAMNSRQKADPCIRAEWSDKPGFWDPLAVVEICLPIVAREVYPNIKAIRAARPDIYMHTKPKPNKEELCPGITMYLSEYNIEEGIEKAVQRYIYYPCQMELTKCVNDKPARALAFMLSYLKYRGPFFTWLIRSGSDTRCLSTTVQEILNHLPDLDFGAAVYIGRHLNYLLNVAYGHNLYYMKSVISKVWGPLYVGVEYELTSHPKKLLTDTERVRNATEVFSRLIDTLTWKSLCPFEGVKRNIQQDKLSRFIRYENLGHQNAQSQLKEPNFHGNNLGDMMHNAALSKAEKNDEARRIQPCTSTWKTSSAFQRSSVICSEVKGLCGEENRNKEKFYPIAKSNVPFPPDNCRLVYGHES